MSRPESNTISSNGNENKRLSFGLPTLDMPPMSFRATRIGSFQSNEDNMEKTNEKDVESSVLNNI